MARAAGNRRRRASLDLVDAKEAVDLATAQSYSENVFLFVPNLIGKNSTMGTVTLYSSFVAAAGYSRVILAGFSLYYMSYHPIYCTLLYGFSCLLDAVDGQAARALGQTSKFGAVLDMVTDRYVLFASTKPTPLRILTAQTDVLHPVCYATYLPRIRHTLFCSNSLSLSTSVVITCTCTGMSILR